METYALTKLSYTRDLPLPTRDLFTAVNSLSSDWLKQIDANETTKKGYSVCINAFTEWLKLSNIVVIDRFAALDYKEYLEKKNFTAGTQRQYMRALKSFFKWGAAQGRFIDTISDIKGAKVKQDNTRKDPFTADGMKTVVNSIDTSTVTGKRNKAMVLLSVTCALRIIELQRADIGDIALKNGERVLYIQGKGHDEKDDYKKITPEVWEVLEDYLKTRPGAGKKDPLFASTSNNSKGKRIAEPMISAIMKQIFRNAGFDSFRLTSHSLRHTSITMYLKAGATLQEAQAHARHTDPKTTEIYAHNIEKEKLHPEQVVYDYLFKGEKTTKEKLFTIISGMSESEAEKLLSFLQK